MNVTTNRPVRAPITASVLVWARTSGNITVEELARSAGVSADAVRSWEAGEARPTLNQLRSIADRVKRPLATFFLAAPPHDPPLVPDFRTVHNEGTSSYSSELILELRRARYLQSRFTEELDAIRPEWRCKIVQYSPSDDPVSCAVEMRSRLGVSMEEQKQFKTSTCGLPEWRSVLYRAGVLSYGFRLDRAIALGFALADRIAPLAAFNQASSHSQRVFTLFHELGHLCLGISAVSDFTVIDTEPVSPAIRQVETFCNRFASAFLLPPGDEKLTESIESLPAEDRGEIGVITKLAQRFRVSKYVVLHRIIERKLLPRDRAASVFASWAALDEEREQREKKQQQERREQQKAAGKPPFGISPAQETFYNRGTDVVSDVLAAISRGRLGEPDAAELLDLPPRHFGSLEKQLASRGASTE